jgi:hypothetical protein
VSPRNRATGRGGRRHRAGMSGADGTTLCARCVALPVESPWRVEVAPDRPKRDDPKPLSRSHGLGRRRCIGQGWDAA